MTTKHARRLMIFAANLCKHAWLETLDVLDMLDMLVMYLMLVIVLMVVPRDTLSLALMSCIYQHPF